MSVYTDLACEARELDPEIEGVTEEYETDGEIVIKRIGVETEQAAKKLNKSIGVYVSLDAPELIYRPQELFRNVSIRISREIDMLLNCFQQTTKVLIVGLGNREVTPDSLGPRTLDRILVTRHIVEYMPEAFEFPIHPVSAIAPGVLGSTGIETYELIKGVVEKTGPDLVIAVDSLASRRASRIGTTVQLSDSGIDPGSGVGNMRAGLNRESLGIPVIALGVPLVVRASTIVMDAVELISSDAGHENANYTQWRITDKELDDRLEGMIVTPKDIDTIIGDMSAVLAEGINRALYKDRYDEVRNLIA